MEPDFDRLRTALFSGVPNRVPTAELKCEDFIKEQFLGEEFPNLTEAPAEYIEKNVRFHYEAGYASMRAAPILEYPQQWQEKTHSYGTGTAETRQRNWAVSGEALIRNEDDFERFPWPDPADATYEWIEMAGELLPDNMQLSTSLKGGGLFERAWMLMGFTNFSMHLAEGSDLPARMIDKAGEMYYGTLERAFEYPRVQAVWLGDDLAHSTGQMVQPEFYRKHLFPWYRRIAELCESYDPAKAFIYHSDGRLWEIMDDLVDCGINALNPIEPKAMDIVEVKKYLAGNVCVIGNIDLGYTLTRGTPEEVRQEVRERIATCGPGGGYVVSSSNSVTEYVPIENYRAMLDAIEEFGQYPLDESPG